MLTFHRWHRTETVQLLSVSGAISYYLYYCNCCLLLTLFEKPENETMKWINCLFEKVKPNAFVCLFWLRENLNIHLKWIPNETIKWRNQFELKLPIVFGYIGCDVGCSIPICTHFCFSLHFNFFSLNVCLCETHVSILYKSFSLAKAGKINRCQSFRDISTYFSTNIRSQIFHLQG